MPEIEGLETAEELQQSIKESQEKLAALQKQQDNEEEQTYLVDMPIADVRLRLSKFQEVALEGVTPAELAFLVAMHHQRAGGNPVISCTPRGTVKRDPKYERARLSIKYRRERVIEMFPGTEPQFPKSFRRAMEDGLSSKSSEDKYMFKMNLSEAAA